SGLSIIVALCVTAGYQKGQEQAPRQHQNVEPQSNTDPGGECEEEQQQREQTGDGRHTRNGHGRRLHGHGVASPRDAASTLGVRGSAGWSAALGTSRSTCWVAASRTQRQ